MYSSEFGRCCDITSKSVVVPNIFQMYEAFGNRAGFYVQRDSWSKVYALVISVQGKKSGPLEGVSPYCGNPAVVANIYGFTNGDQKGVTLSCPGTYAYACTGATQRLKAELAGQFEEALARAQGKLEPPISIS